jgi:hypothetical protein
VVANVTDSNRHEDPIDLGDLSAEPRPERTSRSGREGLGSLLIVVALIAVLAMFAVAIVRIGGADGPTRDAASASTAHESRHETPNAFVVETVDEYVAPRPALPNDVIVDLATGRIDRLPASILRRAGSEADYQVSPNGKRIAFVGSAGRHDGLLFLAKLDGSQVHLAIDRSTPVTTPSWSPDGSEIVYVGADGGIFVLVVSSGTVRRVFHRRYPERVWLPSFGPDGTSIMFTCASHHGRRLGLWTVPSTGGQPERLMPDAAFGTYSPDGSTIAFHRIGGLGGGSWFPFGFHIKLMAADGGSAHDLGVHNPGCCTMAPGMDWDWTRPAWSPDGTRVAFQRFGRTPGDILAVNIGTKVSTAIGRGSYPTWLDDHTLIVEDYGPPVGGLIIQGGSR